MCVRVCACLQLDAPDGVSFVSTFFTFFLLNASFVPISLYVTMKLARSFQKFMMEFDKYVTCALLVCVFSR